MESFKTSDGRNICFRRRVGNMLGTSRVALIHPLALDGSVWDGVAERLVDQAEVLTYDCRGHGRSARDAMPYTTDLFARDLAELLDHVKWPSAVVVGCSMGGCVAQAFAGRYPQRLQALGLIDTTAWYGPEGPRTWRERAATARANGLAGMTNFQGKRWFTETFCIEHPEIVDAIKEIFVANDLACYGEACVMLGDADLRPLLGTITVPVAVMVGDEDYATPISMARQIHEGILGSTLSILTGFRHLTPVEAPHSIAAEISNLLNRIGSRPQTVRGVSQI